MADLIDRDALLKDMGLTDAVKYGNKDAEQQYRSYSTWMSYEIADSIWDAPAVNRWIPVEDDLPENRVTVIFTINRGTPRIGCGYRIHSERGGLLLTRWFDKLSGLNFSDYDVKAWMPMPDAYEPPKEDDND